MKISGDAGAGKPAPSDFRNYLRVLVQDSTVIIYRHKTGMVYLDPQTLRPIDLAALLKERGTLDMEVILNNRQ